MQTILPEILGEIFTWVIPHTPLDDSGREQLIALNLVCKWWQTVALQTHQLWSRVQVPIGMSFNYDYNKAATWLNKAGTTFKEIRLVVHKHYSSQYLCQCGRFGVKHYWCRLEDAGLVRFLSSSSSLGHLTLPSSPTSCIDNLAQELDSFRKDSQYLSWDSIRALTLAFGQGYYVEAPRTSGSIFRTLPSALTSLGLTIASSDRQPQARYEIPSSTLETLKTFKIDCHWDAGRLAGILQHCTGVQVLRIRHRSTARRPAPIASTLHSTRSNEDKCRMPRPATLLHLRSLDVDIGDPLDAEYILGQICVPNLFDVRIHNDDSTPNLRAVYDYLGYLNVFTPGPGNPSIEHITIYERFTIEPSKVDIFIVLLPLLTNIPSLSRLSLDHATFDAEILVATLKQPVHQGSHIAPRLQVLELISPGNHITLNALLKYIRVICKNSAKSSTLKRIELRSLGSGHHRLLAEYHTSVVQDLLDLGVVVDAYV